MVRHGNQQKRAGSGQAWKSGCTDQNLASKLTCHELPGESTGMHAGYIIHQSDNMSGGGSEIQLPRRFWMDMIIHRNDALVVKNHCFIHIIQLLNVQ